VQAAIGAAARELHLPTVRTEADRLAEIAVRERQTHLVNELVEAANDRALSRVVDRYARLDLLLLDELGYVQIDPAERSCCSRSSPNVKNAPRSASAPICPSANGDRCSAIHAWSRRSWIGSPFNAHILETGTQSYRLATSKTSSRKRAS
jgi:hypothetical protein